MIRLLFLQVEPSQQLSPANFTSVLTSNDSFFNQVIEDKDLNKAAQIANTVLEAISQDSSLSTEEKTKVIFLRNNVYKDQLKTEKWEPKFRNFPLLINVPIGWNLCGTLCGLKPPIPQRILLSSREKDYAQLSEANSVLSNLLFIQLEPWCLSSSLKEIDPSLRGF